MLKLSLSDCLLNPLYTGNPKIVVLANSVEQNRMLHNAHFIGSALFAGVKTTFRDRNKS